MEYQSPRTRSPYEAQQARQAQELKKQADALKKEAQTMPRKREDVLRDVFSDETRPREKSRAKEHEAAYDALHAARTRAETEARKPKTMKSVAERSDALTEARKEFERTGKALIDEREKGKPAVGLFAEPARLQAVGRAAGGLEVSGVARLCGPGAASITRSDGVVVGNHCRLKSEEHYHLHSARVSLDPLRTLPGGAKDALREVVHDPDDAGARNRFRAELSSLRTQKEAANSRFDAPVAADEQVTINDSPAVVLGDHSKVTVGTKYVLDAVELQVLELLEQSDAMVAAVGRAIGDPSAENADAFQRTALHAARRVDELAVLAAAQATIGPTVASFGLFGDVGVEGAPAAMVGEGNSLDSGVSVHRSGAGARITGEFAAIARDLGVSGPRPR